MKRFVCAVFVCLLVSGAFGAGTYDGGSGVAGDPYQIATAGQLHELSLHSEDWGKCFLLTSDIDLDGLYMTPIGYNYWNPFSGSFNGGGHIIRNLSGSDFNGLFGYLAVGSEVKCLGLKDIDISGWSSIGGLTRWNDGTVSQCYVTGEVFTYDFNAYCGGLIGRNEGVVRDCYSRARVTCDGYAGGLIGAGLGLEVSRCYSTGIVNGNGLTAGGFVGGPSDSSIVNFNSCFWDRLVYAEPEYEWGASDGYLSRNTYEMQHLGTYTFGGWGGDTWTLDVGNDYPRLAWEGAVGVAISGPTGDGSADNPYQIFTAFDLIEIGAHSELFDKNFLLMADVDMGPDVTGYPVYYSAIIGRHNPFTGVFDGNGHVISNITMNYPVPMQYDVVAGFFGTIGENGIVKKLGVENIIATGNYWSSGGIAGTLKNGEINQCYSTGAISCSYGLIGGLVGENRGGLIRDCYSSCNMVGGYDAGGISGYSSEGQFRNCYSIGIVSGGNGGGLIGGDNRSTFSNCFWDVNINSGLSDSRYGDFDGIDGRPTEDMKKGITYVGWDFVGGDSDGKMDVWYMPEGDYPRLFWEADAGDCDYDGLVDGGDLGVLGQWWMVCQDDLGVDERLLCDFDFDGVVGLGDFAVLAGNWLN